MWVNNAESVSQALSQGLHALRVRGVKQPSRVGDVLVSPNPVLTVYHNPMNRVLFSASRDANPFFHVMESLWMLAGRNDLPWLTEFNKRMATYSDDGGKTQPGAYGHRWREYFGYDQLGTIIVELKNNPQTRRAVLAMWDVGDPNGDHGGAGAEAVMGDLLNAISGSADVPCNTHVYFDTIDGRLNMTVCCRSNDIWWGAHGANAVHFSFLLEYVAAMTGLPMGVYRQFSNNYHLYTNIVAVDQIMPVAREVDASDRYVAHEGVFHKPLPVPLRQVPLVTPDSPTSFLDDLQWFMSDEGVNYGHQFFSMVAEPMRRAWRAHKTKNYDDALYHAERIRAEDWRIACVEWLQRRRIKHELNQKPFTEQVETNTFNQEPDNGAA